MRVKVGVTKELVDKYQFVNSDGCALYHACKDAGLPVLSVGVTSGLFGNPGEGKLYSFTRYFGLGAYMQVKETGETFFMEVHDEVD